MLTTAGRPVKVCRFAYYGWTDLPFDKVFEKQFLIGDSLAIQKKWAEEECDLFSGVI